MPPTLQEVKRVFIQRDFKQGTSVKFQTELPDALRGRIDEREFAQAITSLNVIFQKAESVTGRVFLENCLGCMTAYLIFLCIPTHYYKCLKEASDRVEELNRTSFLKSGLLMVDPAERGLRVIEVCIVDSREANEQPGLLLNNSVRA